MEYIGLKLLENELNINQINKNIPGVETTIKDKFINSCLNF